MPLSWLAHQLLPSNDRRTPDSVTPTSSPLDMLAGMAGGSLGASLVDSAFAPAVESSPWTVRGNIAASAASEDALTRRALADKPGLLSRWENQGKYPLSAEESDLIDHHIQNARPESTFDKITRNEEGSIRIPFKNLAQVTEGKDPSQMSPVEWGKHMAALGKSMRNTAGEAVGANLMDQTGTKDLAEMARRRMMMEGASEGEIPQIKLNTSPNPAYEGLYSPYGAPGGRIEVNTNLSEMHPSPQHPEAFVAGNMGHEVQHALDFLENGELTGQPETLLQHRSDVPWTNENLGFQGAFQPSRMEEMVRHLRETGDTHKLPYWAQSAIDNGHSPETIAKYLAQMPSGRSAAGDILRQSAGNGGFRGTDPLLADKFQTTGHFDRFNSELEIPPYYRSKQLLANGGEVHPDWVSQFPGLKKIEQSYVSPVKPGANFVPPPPSPWGKVGAGATLGALGMTPDSDQEYHLPPHLRAILDQVDTPN